MNPATDGVFRILWGSRYRAAESQDCDQDSAPRQDDKRCGGEPTDVSSQLQSACERLSEREVMRRKAAGGVRVGEAAYQK